MPRHKRIRLTMARKISVASVAAAGAATLALTVIPGATHTHNTQQATADAAPVAFVTAANDNSRSQWSNVHEQYWTAHHNWWLQEERAQARSAARARAAAQARAAAAKAAQVRKAAAAKAAATRAATATPAAATTKAVGSAPTPGATAYANNLTGWINHALAIMAENHIPGTYNGIYRNVMRESSGNPNAINLWDSNAVAGHPSKGLLQTIDSTFNTYHVAGTSTNVYDPVANIVAACNYAYHVYGTIDNVNSAY